MTRNPGQPDLDIAVHEPPTTNHLFTSNTDNRWSPLRHQNNIFISVWLEMPSYLLTWVKIFCHPFLGGYLVIANSLSRGVSRRNGMCFHLSQERLYNRSYEIRLTGICKAVETRLIASLLFYGSPTYPFELYSNYLIGIGINPVSGYMPSKWNG